MGTLSLFSAWHTNVARGEFGKSLSLHHPKLAASRKLRFSSVVKFEWMSLRYPHRNNFFLNSLNGTRVNDLKRFQSVDQFVSNENYNAYVVGGEGSMIGHGKSLAKVLIPSFPGESSGESGAPISSCFWEWKPNLIVHYEKSGAENVNSPPVLFLPGFGVGTFHYEKQLRDLGRYYRAWAVDFLGQGMSLPFEDPTPPLKNGDESEENDLWGFGNDAEPWAEGLVYSIDLWRDQVRYFVEEVIGEPVYIVGNSLGGFVALYFAACNPQLVKGIALLNATPFWGFLPNPIRSPRLSKIFPWAGKFPLPSSIKKLTKVVWQKISDPNSIGEILKQVYADHSTKVDRVFLCILEITKHPAAAAAFASIMFAPRGQLSFNEALLRCQMNCIPICLMYGKEDPWVKPVWGLQVKQKLPEVPYYEISPAGHCPHDEVPEVVNYLLHGWIRNLESGDSVALPLLDSPKSVEFDVARQLEFVREGSKKSVNVQFYGSRRFSLWSRISSYISSRVQDFRINSR